MAEGYDFGDGEKIRGQEPPIEMCLAMEKEGHVIRNLIGRFYLSEETIPAYVLIGTRSCAPVLCALKRRQKGDDDDWLGKLCRCFALMALLWG